MLIVEIEACDIPQRQSHLIERERTKDVLVVHEVFKMASIICKSHVSSSNGYAKTVRSAKLIDLA